MLLERCSWSADISLRYFSFQLVLYWKPLNRMTPERLQERQNFIEFVVTRAGLDVNDLCPFTLAHHHGIIHLIRTLRIKMKTQDPLGSAAVSLDDLLFRYNDPSTSHDLPPIDRFLSNDEQACFYLQRFSLGLQDALGDRIPKNPTSSQQSSVAWTTSTSRRGPTETDATASTFTGAWSATSVNQLARALESTASSPLWVERSQASFVTHSAAGLADLIHFTLSRYHGVHHS